MDVVTFWSPLDECCVLSIVKPLNFLSLTAFIFGHHQKDVTNSIIINWLQSIMLPLNNCDNFQLPIVQFGNEWTCGHPMVIEWTFNHPMVIKLGWDYMKFFKMNHFSIFLPPFFLFGFCDFGYALTTIA
jgi:hypothetical protein